MFIRVYRLEIQSVMLVFSTPFVNLRPSNNLLTGSPPPLPCVNKYRGGGSGYVESNIQELPVYTVYLTRFRTYKVSPQGASER